MPTNSAASSAGGTEASAQTVELDHLDALAARPDVDLVALDAEATRTSAEIARHVTAADLAKPTPCAAWTLYGLLAHLATQHHGFAAAAADDASPAQWQLRSLGDDPVATYQEAADRLVQAFAAPDLLSRSFVLAEFSPTHRFPAAQAVSFHFIDYVVHSWDLARTLGVPVEFDAHLLDVAYEVARAVPGGEARLAPGAAFGPAVAWSAESRLDEIVAMLGRSPDWTPPATTAN